MNKNMELSRQLLLGLKANDFRHPIDLEATNSLKQLPGLDIAVRSLLGSVAEEFFYLNNIGASVLVGEKQLPDLNNLLLEACRILDLEPPQLYIQQNPVPNAYTFAMRGKKTVYGYTHFPNRNADSRRNSSGNGPRIRTSQM